MRLDFVVPGFAKCGTTTLCALLGEHPDVFVPAHKDFRLFDLPDYERRWDDWRERFVAAAPHAVIGDGSIWYTHALTEAAARERLLQHFPEVKLIVIARDPVDRIESAYRELHHSGTTYGVEPPFDLEEALRRFPGLLADSCYARRLDNYRRDVPEDRRLVLLLEDLVTRPEDVLARCFAFLGVDVTAPIANARRRLNARGTKYYDAKRLRALRLDPKAAIALCGIPTSVLTSLLPELGLRHPFPDAPLDWSPEAERLVREHVAADAHRFLTEQGRPLAQWPRLAEMVEARACRS